MGQRNLLVDILVKNAGVMNTGAFKDAEADTLVSMVRLNVEAVTVLTSLFLRPMVTRGRGRILNVASPCCPSAIAEHGSYAASKAYVLSPTEALAEELRGKGITVSALCPGFRHQFGGELQTRERGFQGSSFGAHGRSEIRRSGWLSLYSQSAIPIWSAGTRITSPVMQARLR